MQVVYANEEMPESFSKSLFLAGPTPRSDNVESWRKDALQILEDKGFDGVVFVPETRNSEWHHEYDRQVEWEEKYLNVADCIVFWVPRNLEAMPAFTTNVEFGAWCESGKIVFGAPEDAPKNTYLKYYADKYRVLVGETLTETLEHALTNLGDGAERQEGERYVPLFIWKTPMFQEWYKAQTEAGNKLNYAKLLYSFRPKHKSFVFLWILHVDVFIASENRSKVNEFVLARTDISSVVLYHIPKQRFTTLSDWEVVLVREFRSPARTEDGFIRELPGGSSPGSDAPEHTAAEEIYEETGFTIDPKRLKQFGSRQLAGTLSSHHCHLFAAEINEEEINWFKSQADIAYGNEKDSERTFIEVHKVYDLLRENKVDWSTLGMIMSVVNW